MDAGLDASGRQTKFPGQCHCSGVADFGAPLDGEEAYVAAQEVIVAPDAGQVVGRQTGFLRGTH